MTADAADPRLAELTEALAQAIHEASAREYHLWDLGEPPDIEVAQRLTAAILSGQAGARLLALLPARTATTEAEALAAAAQAVVDSAAGYQTEDRFGIYPSGLFDAVYRLAAVLAATGGEES